jgi:N-acetylneuraminate synthase
VSVAFGELTIGEGHPCLVISEVGINHSGSRQLAIEMIDAAKAAGADAVKFQAGSPERYVNRSAWDGLRETPWGVMPYIEYRKRMELSDSDFHAIDNHCRLIDLPWFVSPLDADSVDRFEGYGLPAFKVASPKLTDTALLHRLAETDTTVLLSTGMSDITQIDAALTIVPKSRAAVLHCVSSYPCPDNQVNLPAIKTLHERYPEIPVGYSGHETGIWPTLAAVAMGARVIERHFTSDRTQWGSDQAASLEPSGFSMMVRGIRSIEAAMQGDGQKALRDSEMANYRKFRSVA